VGSVDGRSDGLPQGGSFGSRPIGQERSPRRRGPARIGGSRLSWLLGPLALFAFALVLRLIGLHTATDLHIDEVTYSEIADSVALGNGVELHGRPFDLHPPGFFLVLGGLIDVFGAAARPTSVERILDLRLVPAIIGSLTCGILTAAVWRTAGAAAGIVAGVLYALDPFVMRFDGRLFLEAPTLFWVATGVLIFIVRDTRRTALLAGCAFGLALLTKDTAAYLTVLPLLLIAAFVPTPGLRRRALTAVAVACSLYGAYLLIVLVTGNLGLLFDDKASGLLRLLGINQETGFNRPGGITLVETLKRNLPYYGASYALCGIGTLCALARVPAIRRGTAPLGVTLLVAIQLCAALHLVYGVLIGTLEEQMFYFMAVPSLACVALAVPLLAQRGRVVRTAAIALSVVWLAASAGSWLTLRETTDDTYRQYASWTSANLPAGARIAVTEETAQFVQRGAVVGEWTTPAELQANRAGYVLLSTRLIEDGFGKADANLERWLDRNGRVVFRARGRTMGELRLYAVDAAAIVAR
jgi:4-amino-4-deoxy-L-arabinose transferase-like glycosyltransferase